MLAKYNQKGSYKKFTKSTDIHKVYMNYNKGKDYIMVNDTEMIKKSRVVEDPTKRSLKKLRKSDVIINP